MNVSEKLFNEPASLNEWLAPSLPEYLQRQRWFGDKARAIRSVEIVASFPIDGAPVASTLLVIEVEFLTGGPGYYALPVTVVSGKPARPTAAPIRENRQSSVVDALAEQHFQQWILGRLVQDRPLQGRGARLVTERAAADVDFLSQHLGSPSRSLSVEQSNSSIVVGEGVFIKVFRRLQPGNNPDVELTRFLTQKAGFTGTPRYLGSLVLVRDAGEPFMLAVAQEYAASISNGWSFLLDLARSTGQPGELLTKSDQEAIRLGRATAEMHLALASDPWTPDMAPEPATSSDVASWLGDTVASLHATTEAVQGSIQALPPQIAVIAEAFLSTSTGLRSRADGFARLVGIWKTRVHGDFHLGQTLRTSDRYLIIDFEGEPQRSIEERRHKTSALKDVAGMLRSFAYARGTVATWAAAPSAGDLVAWERRLRRSFLDAYRSTIEAREQRLIPPAPADFEAALTAWELDKVLYEVRYELNNRPDWVWIPLSGLLKLGAPE